MVPDPTAPFARLVLEADEALRGPLSSHDSAVESRRRRDGRWRGRMTDRQRPSQSWRLLHSDGGLPQSPGPWIARAACRGMNHVMVLTLNCLSSRPSQHRKQIAAAVEICQRCPVLSECRDWALTTPDPAVDHVAGGLTPWQRRSIRRERLRVIR